MTFTRPSILVVDDDPTARLFVRSALEPAGMHVTEADNGREAIKIFEKSPPDLIVLDLVMPEMDGFMTCTKIRSLPGGKRIPILIMTGLEDAASIAQAYEHGATDFVNKPINSMILCHHIRYMLRTSNVLQALVKSEARLELAQRIARIGNWDWTPATGRFSMSNELCRIVGIRPQDFAGTLEAFLMLVHPDDRSAVRDALQKSSATMPPATSTIGSSCRTGRTFRFISRRKACATSRRTSSPSSARPRTSPSGSRPNGPFIGWRISTA
ncbi:MAG: response regulator [Nitrospiraceae bacterium]